MRITVEVDGTAVHGVALIDSGADDTLVLAEWVEALGVRYDSLADGRPSIGVGGSLDTRPCDGIVRFDRWIVCQRFNVAEPGSGLDIALLGREDFFRRFSVRLMWNKDPPIIDLDPVRKRS